MVVAYEQMFIEALVAQTTEERFDKAILHRLVRSDVVSIDLGILKPFQDGVRGQFGAVVGDSDILVSARLAGLTQFPGNANTGERVVHHGGQTFASEVDGHAENT